MKAELRVDEDDYGRAGGGLAGRKEGVVPFTLNVLLPALPLLASPRPFGLQHRLTHGTVSFYGKSRSCLLSRMLGHTMPRSDDESLSRQSSLPTLTHQNGSPQQQQDQLISSSKTSTTLTTPELVTSNLSETELPLSTSKSPTTSDVDGVEDGQVEKEKTDTNSTEDKVGVCKTVESDGAPTSTQVVSLVTKDEAGVQGDGKRENKISGSMAVESFAIIKDGALITEKHGEGEGEAETSAVSVVEKSASVVALVSNVKNGERAEGETESLDTSTASISIVASTRIGTSALNSAIDSLPKNDLAESEQVEKEEKKICHTPNDIEASDTNITSVTETVNAAKGSDCATMSASITKATSPLLSQKNSVSGRPAMPNKQRDALDKEPMVTTLSELAEQSQIRTQVFDTSGRRSFRILMVSHVCGRLHMLNSLAEKSGAKAIVSCGNLGFFDETSYDNMSITRLRSLLKETKTVSHDHKEKLVRLDDVKLRQAMREQSILSDLPYYIQNESGHADRKFNVPVYALWGAQEDVHVIEKVRDGLYVIPNLNILDESHSHKINDVRLLGLGGDIDYDRLFDHGDSESDIAGECGYVWSSLFQIAQLLQTAKATYNKSETRLFCTFVSCGKDALVALLSKRIGANFSVSGHINAPYCSTYTHWTTQHQASWHEWVEATCTHIRHNWALVQRNVQELCSDAEIVVLSEAMELVRTVPLLDEMRSVWSVVLCDVDAGYAIVNLKNSKLGLETISTGRDFSKRKGYALKKRSLERKLQANKLNVTKLEQAVAVTTANLNQYINQSDSISSKHTHAHKHPQQTGGDSSLPTSTSTSNAPTAHSHRAVSGAQDNTPGGSKETDEQHNHTVQHKEHIQPQISETTPKFTKSKFRTKAKLNLPGMHSTTNANTTTNATHTEQEQYQQTSTTNTANVQVQPQGSRSDTGVNINNTNANTATSTSPRAYIAYVRGIPSHYLQHNVARIFKDVMVKNIVLKPAQGTAFVTVESAEMLEKACAITAEVSPGRFITVAEARSKTQRAPSTSNKSTRRRSSGVKDESGRNMCKFFSSTGKCNKGADCRFLHHT
eukprot:CFRG6033T1